jgi:capsular polysaccharide transport system permease protein
MSAPALAEPLAPPSGAQGVPVSTAAAPPAPARPWPLAVLARRGLPSLETLPPAARPRPSLRWLSFVVLVVLPSAIAAVYCFAIAADQYVAEFRFTLSTAESPHFDPLSLLSGNSARAPAALESQILVQYMTSRAIVDRIDASLDLRRLFSPPEADWLARLPHAAPIEELVHYWKGQVDPFYDSANGTVTVRVRGFSPADTLRLAEAVVAASEKLVNDLSSRVRGDAVRHTETEVTAAESRLKTVLGELRAFRDREGMIDPVKTAQATDLLSTRLRDDLVRANAELATLKNYMRDDAPSVKVLKARIRSLEAQRRTLAHELTDTDKTRPDTLSRVLGSYEELEAERKFAETAYQHALQSLDQARANADRQQVFVASFVPPSLPEEALYPRRWRTLGTIALLAFALWSIGCLALQSIREHLT